MKTRDFLRQRKKELEEQIKPFLDLQQELREVNDALSALEEPKCGNWCQGCDICRRGPSYR